MSITFFVSLETGRADIVYQKSKQIFTVTSACLTASRKFVLGLTYSLTFIAMSCDSSFPFLFPIFVNY